MNHTLEITNCTFSLLFSRMRSVKRLCIDSAVGSLTVLAVFFENDFAFRPFERGCHILLHF
jgi:hypothetical protein